MAKASVFTVIMDTYNRPHFLRAAMASISSQTYDNLEIILVDNGGTAETKEYLHQAAASDNRVKLVHFKDNQYAPDDPMKMIAVCTNAALAEATGDYIWYMADDDLISENYAEKMVALLEGNSECTTAAGVTVNIDGEGLVLDPAFRTSNFRPRYMPGHFMALDRIRGGKTLFSAPSTIFTVKRDVLSRFGGFHRSIVFANLYGIVPFGVTGFDETAIFYQRNHEGQLNKSMSRRGWLGIDEDFRLITEWEIERRWLGFGSKVAQEVVSGIEKQICQRAADWFLTSVGALRFRASLSILSKMWRRRNFWLAASAHPKLLFLTPFWSLFLSPSRLLFKLWPALTNLSPRLASLQERVNR